MLDDEKVLRVRDEQEIVASIQELQQYALVRHRLNTRLVCKMYLSAMLNLILNFT